VGCTSQSVEGTIELLVILPYLTRSLGFHVTFPSFTEGILSPSGLSHGDLACSLGRSADDVKHVINLYSCQDTASPGCGLPPSMRRRTKSSLTSHRRMIRSSISASRISSSKGRRPTRRSSSFTSIGLAWSSAEIRIHGWRSIWVC